MIGWRKIEPYKVHLVCSSFIVYFLFAMYLCLCIASNICMLMHTSDAMLHGAVNVNVWAVIARGGVMGNCGDG